MLCFHAKTQPEGLPSGAGRPPLGQLLTVLKSEIKPSTPASFHNIQTLKVVIGLISNHFHEFW